jgi:putative tryptophan/tyrosine transport system substrate-binding protein
MNRRRVISLLGGVTLALAMPPEAWPQEGGRIHRIGVLVSSPRDAGHWVAFFDEFAKLGFVEGRNLAILDGFNVPRERAEIKANEIVEAQPDAIITAATYTALVQQATKTIPILTVMDDVLAGGTVASLAHPGGNTTGISIFAPELDGKRQEILLEATPKTQRLALLVDPRVTRPPQLKALEDSAKARGIAVSTHLAANTNEIMPATDAAAAAEAQALNVLASPLFNRSRAEIMRRAAALRLPAIYQWPETAEEGGLIAYGPRFATLYRQHALQAAKVLRGTSPADIPVEQPTKFELVINLRAAKALGIEMPATLLARADEVIE